MEKKKLKNKTIVVSGGTKGVGRAAAECFARQGAKVVIGGRDKTAGESIVKQMSLYGGEGLFVQTELTSVSDCRKLFETSYKQYERIDGFFNYAGINSISPLETCDEETFDRIMSVNFKACFFCCQEAIKYMRLNHGGSIVLTGSPHAWGGEKERAAYACSKGVLLTLMDYIARNYAAENIRCNCLVMGWTPTENEIALRKQLGMSEAELRLFASSIIPIGRMCEEKDYLELLTLLMSDASSVVTGSLIRATGGFYI